MMSKDKRTPSRIPVRFVDDERAAPRHAASDGADDEAGGLTPKEIGRASSYEGETEVQRRINRGAEQDSARGRDEADERDIAGSLDPSELPENREDQDTLRKDTPTGGADEPGSAGDAGGEAPRHAAPEDAAGPTMAELVATRAELRRVEIELKKYADERQELLDRVARRQADFENYRKRVERERTETYNRVVAEVVGKLLPVLDNLQRALEAESSFEGGESQEFRHFLRGVELISKQLGGVLESLGVQPIETVGRPFDPHVHEAIAAVESDEFEPDTVTEEVARGYRLGDKLLRAAMVKVAK